MSRFVALVRHCLDIAYHSERAYATLHPAAMADIATRYADQTDQAEFAQLLNTALQQLHEGSIARYRLRRSQYLAWQQTQTY